MSYFDCLLACRKPSSDDFCEQKTYHSLETYKPWSSESVYPKKSFCLLIFLFIVCFFCKQKTWLGKQILLVRIHLFTHFTSLAWLVDLRPSVTLWINNRKLHPWGWNFTSPSPITQTQSQCLSPGALGSCFHIFLSAILDLNAPAKSWWPGYHQLAQCLGNRWPFP